jgi:hypothetical protein
MLIRKSLRAALFKAKYKWVNEMPTLQYENNVQVAESGSNKGQH